MDASKKSPLDSEAHKARLAAGAVLVASQELHDPNFSAAVVLLCQYAPEGSYGLILNRPANMPLLEIFEQPPPAALITNKLQRVYVGGPVQPTELQILQIGEPSAPGSFEVAPEVNLGGKWTELEEILSKDLNHIRLFLGYSGWGEGQLEREVDLGAWEVFQIDVKKLLLGPEREWFRGSGHFKRFLGSL